MTLVQDGGDPTLWHGVANGSDVFTVKFDLGTGQYTFTLLNNLDHPDVTTEDNLLLTFGFTASDFDGDKVSGSFGIDVDDDLPTVSDGVNTQINPSVTLALDLDETLVVSDHYNTGAGESGESNGGPPNGSLDDHGPLTLTVSNAPLADNSQAIGELKTNIAGGLGSLFTVSGSFGADGPGASGGRSDTLSLVLSGDGTSETNLSATAVPGTSLAGLNPAERVISLVQVDSTHIEGRILGADGAANTSDDYVVFRITLLNPGDPANAQLQVDQFLPIDHGDDGNFFDTQSLLKLIGGQLLNLELSTTLTDGDGDHATSSATATLIGSGSSFISFDDDGPTVSGVTDGSGLNLVQNGSFEQGHQNLVGSDWDIYSSLPGVWTYGPDNIPFEVQTGGVGGLTAQDGVALVELDSDTFGNPSHQPPSAAADPQGHTDATIQQVIAGTQAGQPYELDFWYSPRPGDGANNDSGLNVLWNGVVVHSIELERSTRRGLAKDHRVCSRYGPRRYARLPGDRC